MIACIDDAIGAVLAALDKSGRRDNTVVIFTSDHGDHLGDHRLMLKGAEQYQSIVRVPFIWADPQAAAGKRSMRWLRPWIFRRPYWSGLRSSPPAACREKLAASDRAGHAGARLGVHPVRPPGIEPGHQQTAAGAQLD